MYYSGFQSNAFQRNAFQIVGSALPSIPITRGGYKKEGLHKKEREHNRSFTKSVKESLRELLDDPVAVEQVKDIVAPYSNSKSITASSIDFRLLAQNVEAAQRLIALAQEFQQEKDDEIAIMLLM
jgi:hypothetical protein